MAEIFKKKQQSYNYFSINFRAFDLKKLIKNGHKILDENTYIENDEAIIFFY